MSCHPFSNVLNYREAHEPRVLWIYKIGADSSGILAPSIMAPGFVAGFLSIIRYQQKKINALSGRAIPERALIHEVPQPNCERWKRSCFHSGPIAFTYVGVSMSPAPEAVKPFL
jgi:hypothetical protein